MIFPSLTTEHKTYRTTLDFCTCGDFRYRHHDCKHIQALQAEVAKAETFLALMRQFDYRQQPAKTFSYVEDGQTHQARSINWDNILQPLQPSEKDVARTNYLNWELSMGL